MGGDLIPGSYRDHWAQGSRQDDLTGAERTPELSGGSSQPDDGGDRITKGGRTAADRNLYPVEGHGHLDGHRVDRCEVGVLRSDDEQSAGCIVGHGVGKRDVPVPDSTVDDFQRWSGPRHRRPDLRVVKVTISQIDCQAECNLRFDLRLEEASHRSNSTRVNFHIREQNSEVRLVHTQLSLNSLGGQSDLAADHYRARGQAVSIDELLNRVRRSDVGRIDHVSNGQTRPTSFECDAQPVGGFYDGAVECESGIGHGFNISFLKHCDPLDRSTQRYADRVQQDPDLDTVLGKAMAILRAFRIDDRLLPLAELVRRTGLPKGTVHRVAKDLVRHRLLEKTDHGYRLAGGLFELGMRAGAERTLLEHATPFLQDLYERTHETVHLGVREGTEVVYIAKIGGHRQARSPSRTGGRMPMHCTAIGKVLLAHTDTRTRAAVLAGPLPRRTPHTIVAPGLLEQQLTRVLETGIAYEREESTLGLLCVAAPVLDADGHTAVAAISVTGPVGRFHPETHEATVRTTAVALASAISRRVGLL